MIQRVTLERLREQAKEIRLYVPYPKGKPRFYTTSDFRETYLKPTKGDVEERVEMSSKRSEKDEDEQFLFLRLCGSGYYINKTVHDRIQRQFEEHGERYLHTREIIVKQNLGLVYSIMERFSKAKVDENDLLSDGMYGLHRAIERFDPFRGFKFSTYACNVMARSLMRKGKQESSYRALFPLTFDPTFELPALVPLKQDNTDIYLERMHEVMKYNDAGLTQVEQRILDERFPLNGEEKRTFKEIGDNIGLSKERVRQIQNIALGKLREVIENRGPVKREQDKLLIGIAG